MTDFDVSAVDLSGVLNTSAEEKAKQVPDPATYHILCMLPKAEEEFSETGILKSATAMYHEELLSPVLFVAKIGPDAFKDEIIAKDETITGLQGELTQAQADIEAAKASTANQAIEVLASIGQPAPLPEAGTESDPLDHIEALATLKGAARTEYYAKHGAEIRQLLTK